MASGSIKKEISNAQSNWQQEFNMLGRNNYALLLILLFGTTFGMFSYVSLLDLLQEKRFTE